ncbi:hypothetical protein HYT02_01630 [Candidatus Gottesmanbacteria bacterium]|nr:hypothetical protein [Candidatus Gottesmanbacteria bacterium]
MKKYSIILSLLFFSVFFYLIPNNVYAAWEKYENNPVLYSSSSGEWDSEGILLPFAIYDEGKFKLWYSGFDGFTTRIGYAWSDDGITWAYDENNPVLSPNLTTEIHYSDPSVIHNDSGYIMWLTVQKNDGSYVIKISNSVDEISWTNPIEININQTWQSSGTFVQPSVIKLGDNYLMWYSAQQNGVWKIGYATSENGTDWTNYANPVLESTKPWEGTNLGSGKVIFRDNVYEIYYHAGDPPSIGYATSGDGIEWNKTEDNLIITAEVGKFDSQRVLSPSIVYSDNLLNDYLFYTGNNGTDWSIGLATSGEIKEPLKPIILLPGLFGSWNSDAIIHGENPPQSEWIMTLFINDYQGLIDTLESAGYINGENLFIFNYDWRDRIEDTSSELNNFIQNTVLPKNPDGNIKLVGHSLGGLIARTYTQNYPTDDIEEVIAVGSPHSGAVQAYKAWEGGVVENNNFWERLALDIIINLNRNGHLTDKDVIREIVPSTQDILPTFDFLRNNQNFLIPATSLIQQNTYLAQQENGFPNIYDKFYAIYGHKNETPEGFEITNPDFIENILGLWQDGKPTNTVFSDFGDETVLAKSATRSADPSSVIENANHRELITTEDGIGEIIDKLDIDVNEIITPEPTADIFPSLFMAIQSPAEFSISGPSGNFSSTDGYIFVPNVIGGNYSIKVNGTGSGIYTLYSGITTDTDSFWKMIINTTQNGQTDNYNLIVNTNTLNTSYIIDTNGSFYLDQAYEIIEKLKINYPHWSLTLASHSIKSSQNNLNKNNYKKSAQSIPTAIKHIISFAKKQSTAYPRNTAYEAITNLSNAYETFKKLSKEIPNNVRIQGELLGLEGLIKAAEVKLKIKGNELKADSFLKANSLLNEAKIDIQNKNYFAAEIKIFIIKELLSEI